MSLHREHSPDGGPDDVVYIHYLADSGTTATREMLARFDSSDG